MSVDTKRESIYMIDAYAIIYRAYFAFIKNPRVNSKGLDTSAAYGFVAAMFELFNKHQVKHVCVAFDYPSKTERTKIYSEYKANREATPEGIKACIPYIKEWLDAMGIHRTELEGYEADDIIGTLAKKAEAKGYDVYMYTPDKDYAQLVSDHIFLYRPASRFAPATIMGKKEVNEKYGFERPEQMIDYLGMMGDASDNIPGLPGVGEKTALKFIQKYGSLEGLLDNIEELKGKQKERILENKQQGIMSKQLATILLNAPVEDDFESMTINPSHEDVLKLFDHLEFRRTKDQYLKLFSTNQSTEVPLFDLETTKTERTIWLQTITDWGELRWMLEYKKPTSISLSNLGFLAIGSDVAYAIDKAWISQILDWALEHKVVVIVDKIKNWIATYGLDYRFRTVLNEVELLAHMVDATSNKRLEDLYNRYVSSTVEIKTVHEHAAEITHLLMRQHIYRVLVGTIQEYQLESLKELEVKLVFVLQNMEQNGISLDIASLTKLSRELQEKIAEKEKLIYNTLGNDFNIASPKQLGQVLFEKNDWVEKPKKNKSGTYSTAEDELKKYINIDPVFGQILDWRGLTKLKNTYVDTLPKHISPQSGRVHAQFNQLGTVTGRLSSSNPNLQNLPINTVDGKKIREAVIPSSSDKVLLAVDYSQIELRLIAAMSQEGSMLAEFRNDKDIHAATAADMFQKPVEQVTRDERSHAKTVNFGIIYGVSAFGLSQQTSLTRAESKDLIERHHQAYPRIQEFINTQINRAREDGFVTTYYGRRRYLAEINSKNAVVRSAAERNAVNTTIQGTAADIIKKAMVDIYEKILDKEIEAHMLIQVHDELVFEVDKSKAETVLAQISELMSTAIDVGVKLAVEGGQGNNWLQAH